MCVCVCVCVHEQVKGAGQFGGIEGGGGGGGGGGGLNVADICLGDFTPHPLCTSCTV